MDRGALPADEPVEVEIEAEVEAILDDRALAKAADRIAEDVDDVGEAVLDAPRLQGGADGQRIAERSEIRLHRPDIAAGGLAGRLRL